MGENGLVGVYKGLDAACPPVVIMEPKSVINLGRDFGVYHNVWHGEPKINIRQLHKYKGNDKFYAVKDGQGIALSPAQCLDLFARLDEVTHCLEQYNDLSVPWKLCCPYSVHIGGNVYVTVEDGPYVQVRRLFLPGVVKEPHADNLLPMRGVGVCLTEEEFAVFRAKAVPYLKQNVPVIAKGIRCGDQLDHESKEGWLRCGHCNPLTSEVWSMEHGVERVVDFWKEK